MRRISNFSTADLHEEHQSALSIASASNSESVIPNWHLHLHYTSSGSSHHQHLVTTATVEDCTDTANHCSRVSQRYPPSLQYTVCQYCTIITISHQVQSISVKFRKIWNSPSFTDTQNSHQLVFATV